ncbi:MAG: SCO6745 family protein [Acidimicrobiia bacterium]
MDFETLLSAYLTWDYDMVMGTFEAVPGSWPPPLPSATPARRLRDAAAPIGEHAIWSRETSEVLAKLGLAFVPGYLWGRAAGLGEPPSGVVAAAFGVYRPELVTALYDEARRQCGRDGFLAAREEATIASLGEILGDADVTSAVTVLRRGVEAADGTGRVLFCGLRSLGWPQDSVGQLWRACDLLREHRGDSHTAAWLAAGLGPVGINVLTELWMGMPLGVYTALRRGWSEADIAAAVAGLERRGLVAAGEITPAGRELRDEIEDRTDALQQPVVDAIGDDFEALVGALHTWSAAIAGTGAFPPGTYQPA